MVCLCLLPSERPIVSSSPGLFGVRFRAVPLGLHFLLRGCVPRLIAWADIGPSPWDFGLIFALIRKIRVICGHLFWNRVVSPRPCASDKTLRGYNDLRVVLSFRLVS